jgi:hypothetical protein
VNTQLLHKIGFVEGNGLRRDTQNSGDLLGGFALGNQLKDLALACGQFSWSLCGVEIHHRKVFGHFGRDIGLPLKDLVKGASTNSAAAQRFRT